tara:strand:- start:126 stop:779 length:654 start_codon:yes stop_codon:yes gene_type:complete
MKKLILTTLSIILLPIAAYSAETRIGFSAALSFFASDGTEITKSSGERNAKEVEEDAIVPGLFIERENDNGFTFGFEYNPGEAELGSGTGSDDDEETSGANKASAEVSEHMSFYGLIPAGPGFVRLGIVRASVDTTENLATGTKYGNEDVNGYIIGYGIQTSGDAAFVRLEGTYTNYDELTFNGSLNGNEVGDSAVRNKVEADIDALALKLSIGKSF